MKNNELTSAQLEQVRLALKDVPIGNTGVPFLDIGLRKAEEFGECLEGKLFENMDVEKVEKIVAMYSNSPSSNIYTRNLF